MFTQTKKQAQYFDTEPCFSQQKHNNYNSDQTLQRTPQYFENRSTQPHSSFKSEADRVYGDEDFADEEEQKPSQKVAEKTHMQEEVDIILMPKELQDFWPSLVEPSQLMATQHEPHQMSEALSVDEFEMYINDMKEFMHLVLKIGFNYLHLYQHNPYAKGRYEELFQKHVEQFDTKIITYFDQFVCQTWSASGVEQPLQQMADQLGSIEESYSHMLYSSLVVMFRALKTLRIQDAIGKRPQERYLFAVACIAAANKCDSNIQVQPLYKKSLTKATFLAQNYAALKTNQEDLVGYEQWKDMYEDHLIQMHNGIIQALDLNLEVMYPMKYIAQAVPVDHPARLPILATCRQILLNELVIQALFCHPKELAVEVFNLATVGCQDQLRILENEDHQLTEQYQDVRAQLESQQEATETSSCAQNLLEQLDHLQQLIEQNKSAIHQQSTISKADATSVINDILAM